MNAKLNTHWKDDLIAGFIVFLIALPLSIGIALAAGAPASAGILSAIIGGIIGTLITGAHITISGPAAGLIVVIGGSITSLSDGGDLLLGFKRTLAATVIAGFLQIFVGIFKLGKLTFLAPSSVIHGMLAAIGSIIMIKQIPIILGVVPQSSSVLGILTEVPSLLSSSVLPVVMISTISFIIIITWYFLPKKFSKVFPSALAIVLAGLALSYSLKIDSPQEISFFDRLYLLGPQFLVNVPESLTKLFIFPKFDILSSARFIVSISTIFIVGTLESLLSAYAVDKLDPQKRKTNLNKDIIGKGIANMLCGLLGAYPIITEIVRSSANISNGAKTKWSNFYHGLFILLFVGLLPGLINHIPLASLAVILFVVGFNLSHPKHFFHVADLGKDQFAYFFITFIITLVEDLLLGIACGILVKIGHHILIKKVPLNQLFSPKVTIEKKNEISSLVIKGPITFLGILKLMSLFDKTESLPFEIHNDNNYLDQTTKDFLKDKNKA